MNDFFNLMLDPITGGGGIGGGGNALGFQPEQDPTLPSDIALAYVDYHQSAAEPTFDQRWTAWGAAYGGSNTTNGNAAVGSGNVAASTFGFAAGMDYHVTSDTLLGFALAGGGLGWGVSGGGSGRSDAFQAGVYAITRTGPAYLSGALAFTNHWFTTTRSAVGDPLTANYDGQSFGARSKVVIAMRCCRPLA